MMGAVGDRIDEGGGAYAVLDAIGLAIIVTTPEGLITYWSRQAEELFGWTAGEAVGLQILEVTPSSNVVGQAEEIFAALAKGESWTGEMVLRRRDGSTFTAQVTDTPLFDVDGRLIGIVGVSADVTDRRIAEAALRREEERLRVALAAGRMGTWEWDRNGDLVVWDHRMDELVGLDGSSFSGTFDDYVELVHPDDRAEVVATIERSIELGGMHEIEHRIVLSNGSVRWINARGGTVQDDAGEVTGLVGVAADVTGRREAEEERERLLTAEAWARAEAEAARGRMQFLAEATAALNEPLGLDDRIIALAEVGAPVLADVCAVYLLDARGRPVPKAAHLGDGSLDEALLDVLGGLSIKPDAPAGVALAVREGRTSWVPEFTDDLLRGSTDDDADLELLRSLGLASGLAVPLRGRDRVIGAVSFVTLAARKMTKDDVVVAETLCDRGGVAIENALLAALQAATEREIRFQATLLRSLNDAAADGILVVSPEGKVLSHNQRFVDLWHFDPDTVETLADDALLDAAIARVLDPDAFIARVRALYAGRSGPARDEIVLVDGTILDRFGTPLHGREGDYYGWAWHFRDVTAERRREAEIVAAGERFAELSRVLQQSLLPPVLPDLAGIDLAARYHPAYQGLDVGGDFYDVFALQDGWMLVIGDVCGKGAEAAALTGLVRYTIRAAAMHADTLVGMLSEVNATMLAHQPDPQAPRFATVCCIEVTCADDGGLDVEVACAGHEAPLVVRADGGVTHLDASGTVLGVLRDFGATTARAHLAQGSALVAVTDGILEARDHTGTFFDLTRLERVLGQVAGQRSAGIAGAVELAALAWQDGIARDDIAVLVVQPDPASP
jgi:PAS domain S-box-containing protein